jgi:hypothetical protein
MIEVLFACPKCGLGMPLLGTDYQPSLMIPIKVRGRLPNESIPSWLDNVVAPVAYIQPVLDGQAYVGHDPSDIKVSHG